MIVSTETAYELASRVSLGMHELMAAATQQLKVSKFGAEFWELSPDGDVMDFVQRVTFPVNATASLASPSISGPDTLTDALPIRASEELLVLAGKATLPCRVRGTAVCVIRAARRTKPSSGIDRGDALGASAMLADQINLSAVLS